MSENILATVMYSKIKLEKIPEEWKIEKLSNVFKFGPQNGLYKHKSNYGSGYKIVELNDLYRSNYYLDSDDLSLVDLTNKEKETYKLNEKDILINRVSKQIEGVAKVLLVKNLKETIIFESNMMRASLNEKIVFPEFFIQYTNSQFYRLQIHDFAKTGNQSSISQGDLGNIKILIPFIEEQQKIASILSKVDEQIEQTKHIIEKNEVLKKGLMQKLLTKGIGHRNFKNTKLEKIPEEWEVFVIKDIIKNDKRAIKVGPFGSQLKKSEYVESGIKVYGQENVFKKDFEYGDYYITKEKFESLSAFEIFSDDVVITMMGTIGDCMVVPKNISKGIMNSHLMRLQLKPSIIPEYLAMLITDAFFVKKQVNRLSQGAIMSGLNSTIIKQVIIPLPKVDEQIKLVEIYKKVNETSNRENRYLAKLQELKKGLMQDLLTGKVRVTV